MATGQIRVTPETMRARAGEYRVEATNLGDIISKMDTLLTTLMDEWEGSASEEYSKKFEQLRPSFVEAQGLIDEIANALDSSANYLEEADRLVGSAFTV